jgi:DNA-binding NtrC family response regulator
MQTDKKTILLIDDDRDCLKTITEILTRFGYGVIAKMDGPSALVALQEGASVDLVITDYQLEGMNGLEFIAEFKKLAPSIPFIMLSGWGTIDLYLKAISCGAFEYLNKPIRGKDIDRVVKAAFEVKQYYINRSQLDPIDRNLPPAA